jgi:hypothetical protein
LVGHWMGDQKLIISSSSVLRKARLNLWSRLHLLPLAPTNPHWARVVGYGPFFLSAIHKEELCPSSGDINSTRFMCRGRKKNQCSEIM